MDNSKFEIGTIYSGSMLYGGHVLYKVIGRTVTSLKLIEQHISEDTGDIVQTEVEKDIEVDNDGEKFILWEYRNHKAYIYAKDSFI